MPPAVRSQAISRVWSSTSAYPWMWSERAHAAPSSMTAVPPRHVAAVPVEPPRPDYQAGARRSRT